MALIVWLATFLELICGGDHGSINLAPHAFNGMPQKSPQWPEIKLLKCQFLPCSSIDDGWRALAAMTVSKDKIFETLEFDMWEVFFFYVANLKVA